jgi:PEGA domain
VTVDGTRVPATASPFVLGGLDPSVAHTIAVEKNGYLGWASRLSLGGNQVLDLPQIKLELEVTPLPAAGVAPTSAAVELLPAEGAPDSTPAPEPDPTHKAKVRAAAQSGGRAPATRASRPTPAPPREKRAAKPVAPKTAPAEPAASKRAATDSAPAAASGSGTGMLRVNSRPWSRVIVDGHLIGNTPQMSIPLRAGKHALNLVNPEFGIDKTVYIEIKAGETVTRVVTLQ